MLPRSAARVQLLSAAHLFSTGGAAIKAADFIGWSWPASLFLAPWLLKDPVRRQDLGFMLAFGAGLALFVVGVEQPVASAPDPDRGNLIRHIPALEAGLWALLGGAIILGATTYKSWSDSRVTAPVT